MSLRKQTLREWWIHIINPSKHEAITPKWLPQRQSKSKSTTYHCRFETKIKLSASIKWNSLVLLQVILDEDLSFMTLRILACLSFEIFPRPHHSALYSAACKLHLYGPRACLCSRSSLWWNQRPCIRCRVSQHWSRGGWRRGSHLAFRVARRACRGNRCMGNHSSLVCRLRGRNDFTDLVCHLKVINGDGGR